MMTHNKLSHVTENETLVKKMDQLIEMFNVFLSHFIEASNLSFRGNEYEHQEQGCDNGTSTTYIQVQDETC